MSPDINILIAVVVSVFGYLIGSISFARVIVGWRAPHLDITQTDAPIPDTKLKFRMNGIGGTSVMIQLSKRWGFFTGFLDWLKVFTPALILRLMFPSDPYFLFFSAFGLIGHNWPVYYRFYGGYGLSTLTAGIMVADWPYLVPGMLIMFATMTIVNKLSGRLYLSLMAGPQAVLPWFWWRTHDWWYATYWILIAAAFFRQVYPDMQSVKRVKSTG